MNREHFGLRIQDLLRLEMRTELKDRPSAIERLWGWLDLSQAIGLVLIQGVGDRSDLESLLLRVEALAYCLFPRGVSDTCCEWPACRGEHGILES